MNIPLYMHAHNSRESFHLHGSCRGLNAVDSRRHPRFDSDAFILLALQQGALFLYTNGG